LLRLTKILLLVLRVRESVISGGGKQARSFAKFSSGVDLPFANGDADMDLPSYRAECVDITCSNF